MHEADYTAAFSISLLRMTKFLMQMPHASGEIKMNQAADSFNDKSGILFLIPP